MPGGAAQAVLVEGEVRFLVNGRAVIERVFVAEEEAGLVLAQWRLVARELTITGSTRPGRPTRDLRTLVVDPASVAARQILELDAEIRSLEEEIARTEAEMEALLAVLYGLTREEQALLAVR